MTTKIGTAQATTSMATKLAGWAQQNQVELPPVAEERPAPPPQPKLERGTVIQFNETKRYGFLELGQERVFFYLNNNTEVVVVSPGTVKLGAALRGNQNQPRLPRRSETVYFIRAMNDQGPYAQRWCYERDYDRALDNSKRAMSLSETKRYLADKPCHKLLYTEKFGDHIWEVISLQWVLPAKNEQDQEQLLAHGQVKRHKPLYKQTWEYSGNINVYPQNSEFKTIEFDGELAWQLQNIGRQTVCQGEYVDVSWNGGWDKYVVDLSITRPLTAEECGSGRNIPELGDGWLRCSFMRGRDPDNTEAVKIIRHLGGGD